VKRLHKTMAWISCSTIFVISRTGIVTPRRAIPDGASASNRSTAKQQDRFFGSGSTHYRFFAGVVVLQVVKGREGSFSVPGGQKR
jgi:hypothetical protein